jgi:replication factor C small subunit
MSDIENIWFEKYRPQTLNDMIIDDGVRNIIENFGKDIPHLLLTGTPGVGKTSLAKIICNDILKCDHLYINASDENGVDTIREKVVGFAQTMSFDGGIKIVILDECDGLSKSAQRILRNVIESYSATTRFILTGNYKHKIEAALQSRCQSLTLHTSLKDVVRRCCDILKQENIEIPNDQKKNLVELIKSHYPDIRKCINELEKYSKSGILNITSKKDTDSIVWKIYDNLLKAGETLQNTRKFLIENEELFDSDHELLLKDLLNYIYELDTCSTLKTQLILVIADHLFKMVHVSDREICCLACLLQLEELVQERM